jgi:methylglutaconyl-CoA hydratase
MSVLNTVRLGTVLVLELNRPDKRNALNDELVQSLKAALRDADADDTLRCIVMRGAGKDFCSGADLSSIQKTANATYEENVEDARELAELFLLIRQVRIPVVAAVHGRALAGGCGLATACDLVVATPTARFGYPEVKIGFVPAMVAAILRRNLGDM